MVEDGGVDAGTDAGVDGGADAGRDAGTGCLWEDRFDVFRSSEYHLDTSCGQWGAGDFVLTSRSPQCRTRLYYVGRTFDLERFQVELEAYAGMPSGGDGITIAFVQTPTYPRLGTICPSNCGGHLDFDGATGFAVELDTWPNPEWDPLATSHVALIQDTTTRHLAYTPLTIADGAWHRVVARFDRGRFTVWVDGYRVLDTHPATAPARHPWYVGVTAATGSAVNEHRIDNLCIRALP